MPFDEHAGAGMRYRYYHDEEAKTLWAVPSEPFVEEKRETRTKRRRYPKRIGWRVHAEISITHADNRIDPATGFLVHPTSSHPSITYPPQDTREDAVSYFRAHNLRFGGVEITREDYEQLRAKYEAPSSAT